MRKIPVSLSFVLCLAAVPLPAAAEISELAPGLFRYRDTCNVYSLVRNGHALLIDFGSGGILQEMPKTGSKQADWILHTHFHRDQCQGDELAIQRGIRIAAPAAERSYFESAESLWQAKKVFHLYDLRNEFFAPRKNIPLHRALEPNSTFEGEGLGIRVIPVPGHTAGSVAYLVKLNDKTFVFSGDLIASPGKILTIHDLEQQYVGARGIQSEIASLRLIRQIAPDVLLPSHGEPTYDVQNAIPDLMSNLAVIHDEYNWFTYTLGKPETGITRLTPHVWHAQTHRGGTAYVVVSDSGRAFMWDCNFNDLENVAEIQRKAGFRQLDFIAVSHYHDDHIGGVNEVRRRYGAKFWAMRHMVDVLEHPMAYNIPCLWHEPARVDRVLEDGEKIVWEGIPLQFFYLPGQTEYAQGLLLEVDGKRILFDGDNIAHPIPGRPMLGHYVSRNYQRLDGGHIYCARKFLELRPDFIAPNHFEWVAAGTKILDSYLKNAEEMKAAFTRILDQPDPMFGIDNNWLSVYPYQVEAEPGQTVTLEIRYRNWLYAESRLKGSLRAPSGWSVEPGTVDLRVPAKSQGAAAVTLRIPRDARKDFRYVVTVDAVRDGLPLGEITEALINMAPMKAH